VAPVYSFIYLPTKPLPFSRFSLAKMYLTLAPFSPCLPSGPAGPGGPWNKQERQGMHLALTGWSLSSACKDKAQARGEGCRNIRSFLGHRPVWMQAVRMSPMPPVIGRASRIWEVLWLA
jgi:hypothetical protein